MGIKGFIEVHSKDNVPTLVNVRWIEEVYKNTIYYACAPYEEYDQDKIVCVETYEEICEKLKEATK